MKYSFEDKWYKYLLNRCNILNPSIVYKSTGGNQIALSDIFIQQHVVQDAVYGIGRRVSEKDGEYRKQCQ